MTLPENLKQTSFAKTNQNPLTVVTVVIEML